MEPSRYDFDVFVSHASADNPRATDLAQRLIKRGLDVWIDVRDVNPGEHIYLRVEDALARSRAFLICLSTASVQRRWVDFERATVLFEDPTNSEGRFIPVLLEDCEIPRAMRAYKYIDYRQHTNEAFDQIVDACRNAGRTRHRRLPEPVPGTTAATQLHDVQVRILQSPPLPAHFVERALQNEIRSHLGVRRDSAAASMTTVVLHGTGGSGKTALARGIAHDPEVHKRFADGILWMQLDDAPNLRQRFSDWGRALGDPQVLPAGYPDDYSAVSSLRSILQNKSCLLIVDDWGQHDDVERLLVGGPRCALLITTRFSDATERIHPFVVNVDSMTEPEAWSLLTRLVEDLSTADERIARRLVGELGFLPLAIELMCARVNRLGSWSAFESLWNAEKVNALRRGRHSSGRQHSAHDCFAISLQALPAADRERYFQLAIFPRKVRFPASAAAALWDCDVAEANELLADFSSQALVKVDEKPGRNFYYLHDLLTELASSSLGASAAESAHRALLAGYRRQCQGDWATLADDGYILDHLVYHFERGGAADQARLLFNDDRWLRARVIAAGHDYAGALADVGRTWAIAERETSAADQVADGFLCAVVSTSINSVSDHYEPTVAAEAVSRGIWSLGRVLTAARRTGDPLRAARLFAVALSSGTLAPAAADSIATLALSAASRITLGLRLVDALAAIAISSTDVVRQRAIEAVLKVIDNENAPAIRLATVRIAPALNDSQRRGLLQTMLQRCQQNRSTDIVDEDLVEWLPLDLIPTFVAAVRDRDPSVSRDIQLSLLAARGDEALAAELLSYPITNHVRPYFLASVGRALSHAQRARVVDEVWDSIDLSENSYWSLRTIVRVFPLLSRERQDAVLEHLRGNDGPGLSERVDAMARVALFLEPARALPVVATAVDVVLRRRTGLRPVARAVAHVGERGFAEQLFPLALAGGAGWVREPALDALVPLVSDAVLEGALDASVSLDDDWGLPLALSELGSLLAEETLARLRRRALELTFQITHSDRQTTALEALLPGLSDDDRRHAVALASGLQNKTQRALLLTAIANSGVPGDGLWLRTQAIDAAFELEKVRDICKVMSGIGPHLTESELTQVLERARLRSESDCEDVIVTVAAHLTPALATHAAHIASEFTGPYTFLRTIEALWKALPATEQTHASTEARFRIRTIIDFDADIDGALSFGWCLSDQEAAELVAQLPADLSVPDGFRTLTRLAIRSSGVTRRLAVDEAVKRLAECSGTASFGVGSSLASLLPLADSEQQSRVLDWAVEQGDKTALILLGQQGGDDVLRTLTETLLLLGNPDESDIDYNFAVELFAAVEPRLTRDEERREVIAAMIAFSHGLTDPDERSAALVEVAKRCDGNRRHELLEDALDALPLVRWNKGARLESVAPLLDDALTARAVKLSADLSAEDRARALAALLPRVPASERAATAMKWLRAHEHSRRSEFIEACVPTLFAPDAPWADARGRIADVFANVCFDWRWP